MGRHGEMGRRGDWNRMGHERASSVTAGRDGFTRPMTANAIVGKGSKCARQAASGFNRYPSVPK